MSVSFDTLSFAKRLTEAGEKPAVAEAHAMALKEFVMDAIATKADIQDLGRSIGEEIHDVRDEISDVRVEVRGELAKVRGEIVEVRTEMRDEFTKVRGEIADVRTETREEFAKVRGEITSFRREVNERFATKDELRHEIGLLRKDIDAMGLKLTVRMGGMLAVAVGAVATLGKVV
jgi:predicted  nucleic acid-binding Zn-ribbon protein